ncbi:CotH kinase family protein [Bacteroidota bacterium]
MFKKKQIINTVFSFILNTLLIHFIFNILLPNNISSQNLTSSNLPIVIINTEGQTIPDEPKISATMGIIHNGDNQVNNITDPFNIYNGLIGIEQHGSASLKFPKHTFGIETRDSLGNNLNVSILGFPEENDWILYAPYSDKTLMRNVLIYNISNAMGQYTSRSKYCELILNNNYEGIYVLLEKVKRDKERVDISRMDLNDNYGDDLTGGYLLQIDRPSIEGWFSTFPPFEDADQRVFYEYRYPKPETITENQKNYIQNIIYNFESLLSTDNYNDPVNGYYKYVDFHSLIDFVLLNEFPKNVDSYRLSTYLYKDRDNINSDLQFGPIWDFNIAFGNADFYRGKFIDGWQILLKTYDDFQPPFWFMKIWLDNLFNNKVSARWFKIRENLINQDYIYNFIDSTANYLSEAQERNFTRWPILGEKVWPNPVAKDTYEEEVDVLKEWIRKRIDWMDKSLNSDYSFIEWVDSLSLYASLQIPLSIPTDEILSGMKNIDYIEFVNSDNSLDIEYNDESITLTLNSNNEAYFRGLGFFNGILVEISPKYKVLLSPTSTSRNINYNSLIPEGTELLQNYPNPFNPKTKIEFRIPSSGYVTLKVNDLLGTEISTILKKYLPGGKHSIDFYSTNLPSGIYYYSLKYENHTTTKKMIILK